MNNAQPEVPLERVEVAVAVQQPQSVGQAACGDEHVDGAAHRHAGGSQPAIVACRLDGERRAADDDLLELAEQPPGFVEAPVVAHALQHLGQDQVADGQHASAVCLQLAHIGTFVFGASAAHGAVDAKAVGLFMPPVFEGTHYPYVNNSLWTIKFEFACYLLVAAAGEQSMR